MIARDIAPDWGHQTYGAGWQLGVFNGEDLLPERDVLLSELVEVTGAPALWGFVVDSDFVDLVMLGQRSGRVHVFLGPESAEIFMDEFGLVGDESDEAGPDLEEGEYVDLEEQFPDQVDATSKALAWAHEAGLSADAAAVAAVFTQEADPLAEDLMLDLLDALGIHKTNPT
ncbi:MAG: hypothetical protein QM714_10945 [Nocardioides sp.]|uniref:hypothetical protein n=1 Tax=Nocardioides sp. TaxID=35761 RepID=UPI0039E62B2D